MTAATKPPNNIHHFFRKLGINRDMKTVIAACLLLASQTYSVPPVVLAGIYKVESGQVGQEVGPNKNGSYDLGPMQINTIWLPELAKYWGVSEKAARRYVRDDACTNFKVAAWILRGHINETKNLSQAIAHYHSRTYKFGSKYHQRVLLSLRGKGVLRTANKPPEGPDASKDKT